MYNSLADNTKGNTVANTKTTCRELCVGMSTKCFEFFSHFRYLQHFFRILGAYSTFFRILGSFGRIMAYKFNRFLMTVELRNAIQQTSCRVQTALEVRVSDSSSSLMMTLGSGSTSTKVLFSLVAISKVHVQVTVKCRILRLPVHVVMSFDARESGTRTIPELND